MPLAERLFEQIPEVRYVAVARGENLSLAQRAGLADASEAASDRYEELLVNPAVLLLTQRRGNIDCGGLDYVLVRYGNFFQLVIPTDGGHVSVAIELGAELEATVDRVIATVRADAGP
ncbi:MAG: hypothetical protein AAGM22_31845 [Acidobacteriota bacterium]